MCPYTYIYSLHDTYCIDFSKYISSLHEYIEVHNKRMVSRKVKTITISIIKQEYIYACMVTAGGIASIN